MGSGGRAASGSWVLVKGWVQASGFRGQVDCVKRVLVDGRVGLGRWALIGGFRVRWMGLGRWVWINGWIR